MGRTAGTWPGPCRCSTGPTHSIKKWLGTCTDIDDQKRAEGMLGFLAEVSTVLASSLDYETTLAAVARLAVPHVADWCVVDIAEPDGSIRRLAVAHADPAQVELGRELGRRYPPHPADETGVAAVLRTGRPEVIPTIDPASLERSSRSPAHLELLQALQLSSSIAAPLIARGRTIGVISLAMAESGRAYSAVDLPLVEDLARRAALAVDNARLYREAQQAREEAEAANRAKDRFLAILGHELRTPLTPVLAEVSALLDDPTTPADFRPVLEMTRRNVELEARLIDDLLDLSRIARGKLRLRREPVDLHTLVEQALAICQPGIAEAGLTVSRGPRGHAPPCRGRPGQAPADPLEPDQERHQVHPAGGTITVRTRDVGPGEVAVEVTDTGAGITPEAIARIFAPFDQGDPSSPAGSAASAWGWRSVGAWPKRTTVASRPPPLASVWAPRSPSNFPTCPAPAASSRPRSQVRPGAAQVEPRSSPTLRLLLVEDDADTRRVLARLLRGKGHQVTTAGGDRRGGRLAARDPFDLLDRRSRPARRERPRPPAPARRSPPTAAIALSGSGMEEDLKRSRESGFDAHLIKPIDFAALEATLNRVAATAGIVSSPRQ